MTAAPAGIAAEQAILRQNVALSVIKQSADQAQALVQILDDAARSAPVSRTRGTNINTSA
ncbi:MAG: putative motility protein [Rhodospirillales bacterium]|nr:putative motility protein [Rhodospirillales bacterium]